MAPRRAPADGAPKLDPRMVVGVFRGHCIRLGDVVLMSRAKARLRHRNAIANLVAQVAASVRAEPRDVPRALGKWRGSTIGGYVFRGDDQTYVQNFRMTSPTMDTLIACLASSDPAC